MNRFSELRSLARKFFGWWNLQGTLVILLVGLMGLFTAVVFSEDVAKHVSQGLGIPEKEGSKNEALKFLGFVVGGILIAIQAAIADKRAKAMQQTAEAQAKATEEQANANRHTEQGQRQERLKNAIEHLGHTSDSVRLGGAYELFHLARDTEELRQTVLDILCAHIRWTTGKCKYQKMYKWKPSEEVQSLLTLLFVRQHEVFRGLHVNLEGSWLNGAELSDAYLENAVLDKASLKVAMLYNADMRSTKLEDAHLHGAHLIDADLHGAWFWKAQLYGAWLNSTNLREASFEGAHLQGARLINADLQGAGLGRVHLQGAFFDGANLRVAFLGGARLQGANFWKTQLQGAGLEGAWLHGVGSQEVDTSGTFAQRMRASVGRKTDLAGTILAGGLNQEDVDSLVEGYGRARILREKLITYVGMPESHELPQDSGAITGAYTEEEAEGWIAEYEEAMSEVPEVND